MKLYSNLSSTMSQYRFPKDPLAKQEHEKYANPLPSREYIFSEMTSLKTPISVKKVAQHFRLKEDEEESLRRRLNAMVNEGKLIRDKRGAYGLLDAADLVRGTVSANKEGFGFLVCEEDCDDLFISAREMQHLMHGDSVLAAKVEEHDGRFSAHIVEVLERVVTQVVGQLGYQNGVAFVIGSAQPMSHDLMIAPEDINGAVESQWVVAEILHYPKKGQRAIGRIKEVLGDDMAPGLEIDVALHNHHIPSVFSEVVLAESKKIPESVEFDAALEQEGYVDLTDIALVTIDGEDAKDFDDAVYCEQKENGGFRLLVAIADVSKYVLPGSALDEEAIKRGNSVYFPGRVVPMLPESLSNGICSLKPKVNRLALVCEMHFDANGDRESYDFYRAIICSKARLTYTQVGGLLEEGNTESLQMCLDIIPHLYDLYALYVKLLTQRQHRGAIEFDTTETRIVFGAEKKIDKIVPVYRNVAHRLIEECMLAANVSASDFVLKHKKTVLYRNHEVPLPEKIENLQEFLQEFGLHLRGGDTPRPADYAEVLEKIQEKDEKHLLQTVILRSLMQALYAPENLGHFGLGYDSYTHFTSPIRRYPDLLLHRAIKAILDNGAYKPNRSWDEMGSHCSMTERRADDATREVVAWLKCEYMQQHIGEVFEGIVTGAAGFGIFVTLDDIFVEGLVHVSSLKDDYYSFDSKRHALVGENLKQQLRLGDTVTIKVMQVSLDRKQIDFELVAEEVSKKKPKKKKKAKKNKAKKSKSKSKSKD